MRDCNLKNEINGVRNHLDPRSKWFLTPFIIFGAILCLTNTNASAIPAEEFYNLRLGVGIAVGKAKQPGSGEVEFFGVPITGGIWFHPSRNWSTGIEARLTPDLANPQLARRGIEGGFSYHVLGGSPSVIEGGGMIGVDKGNFSSLSILAKTGYFTYSLSDPKRPSQKIEGAILTSKIGIALRLGAYEIEGLTTLLSIPAGTERVEESAIEVLLGYRWQM